MSRPSSRMAPPSGRSAPAIRLKSDVLPAPFGPMMPSAVPSATARSMPSATSTEPKALTEALELEDHVSDRLQGGQRRAHAASFASACGTLRFAHPTVDHRLLDRLHLAADRESPGRFWLSTMTMSYLLPSLSRHWPPTSGVLAMFLAAKGGRLAPSQRDAADDRVELGRGDRLRPSRPPRRPLAPLQDVDRDLEQRVDEADRLRPLLAGRRARRRRRASLADMPVSDDLNGWLGDHQTSDDRLLPLVAERLDRDREEDRLADRRRLRLEALLARLVPEGGEVRRQHHAGDDLAPWPILKAAIWAEKSSVRFW